MTDYRLSEYDRKRQQELNSANAPLFWLGYVVVVVGVFALMMLTPVLDWVGL